MQMMSFGMALKTMLYFISICFVLGRPSILRDQKASRLPPPRANSHLLEVKIPPYMMHLYQTLTGKSKDLPQPEKQILEESDTVQSFSAKNCILNKNRWSLTFDLSPLSITEELRLVELRVHFPPTEKANNVTLDIYKNGQGKLFLGSVTTAIPAKQHSTWRYFNVTKIIEQNLLWGNKMDAHTQSGDKPEGANLEYSTTTEHVCLHKNTTNEAMMMFYTKEKPFIKRRSPSLLKPLSASLTRMARLHMHKRNKNNKQQTPTGNTNPSPTEMPEALCRKVDMVIDFKELGWDNWVVYPKKYNGYRCEGTCHTPLKETSMTTNYDYIKSFLKLRNSERVECSSCVPLKMRPLSMLLHEDKDLVFRHLEDMIIEECGFK